jgi:hypothetical protein
VKRHPEPGQEIAQADIFTWIRMAFETGARSAAAPTLRYFSSSVLERDSKNHTDFRVR